MVKLISGTKGSGKTKEVVELANQSLETAKGNIIFIDRDNRPIYDLHHDIRFVNLSEFPVKNECEFLGFLCGLISNNYDIEQIYIDSVMDMKRTPINELEKFFERIESISKQYEIDFKIVLNSTGDMPESLKKYH